MTASASASECSSRDTEPSVQQATAQAPLWPMTNQGSGLRPDAEHADDGIGNRLGHGRDARSSTASTPIVLAARCHSRR